MTKSIALVLYWSEGFIKPQCLRLCRQRIRAAYELFENKRDGVIKVAEKIKEEKEENN